MSFLTLAQGHLHMKIETCFFSKTTGPFLSKFCMQAFDYIELKMYQHDAGHMTKMAAMPIYGINPSKILSGNSGLVSKKLGM